MKINFLAYNPSDNRASYRIWVRDLSKTLKDMSIDASIKTSVDKIDNDVDVIILCKSCYKECSRVKHLFPGKTIGAINIDKDYHNDDIEFVIVGSYEEYISMSYYDKVFMYPLIERIFENQEIKLHKESDILSLCFHGNYPHLFKFEPFLREAIEKFNNEVKKIKLNIITNPDWLKTSKDRWIHGKPNVEIVFHEYNLDTMSDIIKSCDIGLVPNVSDIRLFVKDIQNIVSPEYGLYNTDFFLRMKNKTNNGRAYVFYQHGIPVIHDISPSNFDFMGRTGCYNCAHDTQSWFRELKKLSSIEYRNKVAKTNYDIFKRDFSVHDHAEKLLDFIKKEVHNE